MKDSDPDVYLGKCNCYSMFSYRNNLNCSIQPFQAQIPRNYWLGNLEAGEDSGAAPDSKLVMALLPNFYTEQGTSNGSRVLVLPQKHSELDDSICGGKFRTGIMCGMCKDGYSAAVNSYDYVCVQCNNETNLVVNIVKYMTFAYLPYIVLLSIISTPSPAEKSHTLSRWSIFLQCGCLQFFPEMTLFLL